MLTDTYTLTALIITTIICFILSIFIYRKKYIHQLGKVFLSLFILLLIWCIMLIGQIVLTQPLNTPPIYWEYGVYMGACFLPVALLFLGFIFANTKIKLTKRHFLLLVIPLLSLLVLWTNDFHHLFYETYSIIREQTVYGPYFYIHTVYSYVCLLIGVMYLLIFSIKNSGFFSKQSILIVTGSAFPIIINILFTLNIINLSIYMTPISFAVGIIFYAFAMFKFNLLNITPVALQRIVDNISDGYIVLNEENKITDFNKTFITIFSVDNIKIRNFYLNDLTLYKAISQEDLKLFNDAISNVRNSTETIKFERKIDFVNKIFNIEINSITNKGSFLGTLILFKDVTQHHNDMQIIKSNQELLMEKERLASLGQLIGGIAHNLKTPIMSISGAAEGLSDLSKEYDISIEDTEVTKEDHHEIAKEMLEWISRIKIHTEYMSDVITAVKGQAVALSSEQTSTFNVAEIIKHVNILMKHELKNALIELNVSLNVDDGLELKGNINSLVQVINNMISNSIQSYQGKTNEQIYLIVNKVSNNLVISIKDYGMGINNKIKNKLFKEMITTKGKNGTGLGLFMSYSNIRAHFNGTITLESEVGKGTTFNIFLPIEQG